MNPIYEAAHSSMTFHHKQSLFQEVIQFCLQIISSVLHYEQIQCHSSLSDNQGNQYAWKNKYNV